MTKAALEKMAEEMAVPSYKDVPLLTDPDFEEMAREYAELGQRMKADEERKTELSADLQAYMLSAEVTKVKLWDDLKMSFRKGRGASTIQATRLLELGVPLTTIQEATKEGSEYTYVQIERPKQPKPAKGAAA